MLQLEGQERPTSKWTPHQHSSMGHWQRMQLDCWACYAHVRNPEVPRIPEWAHECSDWSREPGEASRKNKEATAQEDLQPEAKTRGTGLTSR